MIQASEPSSYIRLTILRTWVAVTTLPTNFPYLPYLTTNLTTLPTLPPYQFSSFQELIPFDLSKNLSDKRSFKIPSTAPLKEGRTHPGLRSIEVGLVAERAPHFPDVFRFDLEGEVSFGAVHTASVGAVQHRHHLKQ